MIFIKPFIFCCLFVFLCVCAAAAGTVHFAYDNYGQVSQAVYEDKFSIRYSYDGIGNRLTCTVTPSVKRVIQIFVKTDTGVPLQGVFVYAFNDSESFTGLRLATDENGIAAFYKSDFPAGDYKFGVAHRGEWFWSEIIPLPGSSNVMLTVEPERSGSALPAIYLLLLGREDLSLP